MPTTKSAVGKKPRGGSNGAANRGKKAGQGALRPGSAIKHSNASSKAGRTAPTGETRVNTPGSHMRTEGSIKRLAMYNHKPNRAKMKEQSLKPMRIEPDRRWFGNTRTIAQDKMQAFRETIAKGVEDPFSVVLKSSKLPMSLLRETESKSSRMDLLSVSPYQEVFSKKHQQKRVKQGATDLEGLLEAVERRSEDYASGSNDKKSEVDPETGLDRAPQKEESAGHCREEIFDKGTSRRIWGELYKVVDASDVLVFVLDARDPQGTRCKQLERELRKNRTHKHIILLINKVDLVPTWVTRRWITELMKDFPTIAFHASITNPFGKNSLLNLLRQFGTLLKDKKHITVGMIGYPNVGKSSVINTLKRKKVCKAAPVPGETRVWQYIALTKKIYMLDCPGIVPPTVSDFNNDCAKVLKGVVRAERLKEPSAYIDEVLERVKKPYLLQRYKLPLDTKWEDGEEFLAILCNKMGKLGRGGEPALDTCARIVLYDWQRGRIPYFTPPPEDQGEEQGKASSSTGGEAGKDDAKDKSDAASAAIVQQSLNTLGEIECVHVFDAEDRRGEDVAPSALAASMDEEGGEDGASKKKKRKADAGEGGEAQASKPKKKLRRGKGGASGSGSADGSGGLQLKTGSVDWKAVMSEFGV